MGQDLHRSVWGGWTCPHRWVPLEQA